MRRFLRIFLSAAILAFLALSPPWLLEGMRRDAYRPFFERPKATWHGRIELWHIAGFRVYQGSVTDYLQERAEAYCKKHPGVHIDVLGLTEKQYRDRLDRGAYPDAYSFPPGYVYAEQLGALTLEAPAFIGNLSLACQGGTAYAAPYMMSGYFLAANTQLLTQYDCSLPEETVDAKYLQSALALTAKSPQLAMPAVHAARLRLTGAFAEADAFLQGKCMLSVLDARALGDILRGETALLVDALPLPDYTDEVFYIGGSAHADPQQLAALSDFVAFLLSEKEQLRLTQLGALPVTQTEEKPVYAEDLLSALYKAYATPVAPQPFLYERHRAKLFEEAAAALNGDASSSAAFFERLAVVESGEL